MGRVMHRIDVGERAHFVRPAYHFMHRIDGTDSIRGVAGRDYFCARIDFASQVVHIERAVRCAERDPLDGHTFFFERLPGGKVGVVIEEGDDDFVARPQFAPDRAAHRIRKRSHVEAEDDLIALTTKEVGHGGAGAGNDFVGAAAGEVRAAGVRIGVLQVIGDRVDYALRDLGSSRAVEICGWVAVHGFGKGRKLGTDGGQIESGDQVVLGRGHGFSIR